MWPGLTWRIRMAIALRVLLSLQLIASFVCALYCCTTSHRVLLLLRRIHEVTVRILCGQVTLQVYIMKLHSTAGLRLVSWIQQFPGWRRAELLCKMWATTGTLVACNGLFVCHMCEDILKTTSIELSPYLRIGMTHYLVDSKWKKIFDNVQMQLECCGVDKSSDWHEIPWIGINHLNDDSDIIMRLLGPDGKIRAPVTPYSCCKSRVLSSCYHDPFQQIEASNLNSWIEDSGVITSSVHARGCVAAILGPLAKALLGFKFYVHFIFFTQIVVFILTVVLMRSVKSAALQGEVVSQELKIQKSGLQPEDIEEAKSSKKKARLKKRKLKKSKD